MSTLSYIEINSNPTEFGTSSTQDSFPKNSPKKLLTKKREREKKEENIEIKTKANIHKNMKKNLISLKSIQKNKNPLVKQYMMFF